MRTHHRRTRRATTTAILAIALLAVSCRREAPQASGPRAPLPAALDSAAALAKSNAGTGGSGAGEAMPLVIAGGKSADSIALAPLLLNLRNIGYRDGLTLYGTADEVTVAVPVNDGMHPVEMRLHVLATPRMPPGTLVLRQRDHILALRDVSDTTTTIVLPLDQAVVDHGKATLTLALSIPGREACQAPLYYRTVLAPESQIAFAGAPAATEAVNGFFQPWVQHVTFYLADQPSLDAAQAALDAAAFVARHYRGMTTTYDIKALPAAGSALAEPGPYDRALVWSPNGSTNVVRPDKGRGTLLAIAARRDARQLFTLADGSDAVAAGSFRTSTVDLAHNTPDPLRTVHTLGDLGFESRTVEGNSLVIASYPVALADFGGTATPTAFRLIARHSVLPANGSGSLRVHLNGSLITSRALDRNDIDMVVALPPHLLRRDNIIEVRFQVTLGEGQCLIGGQLFTATVDNASAFVVDGSNASQPPGFARFPSSFVPAFSVLLEPRDRFRIELASTVIGAMQQTTHTPLAPALARDRASATGPLLAVGTSSLAEALDAPLQSDGFKLRDRAGKVWDDFTPEGGYGAMQGWDADGRDILLLHHTKTNGQPLADLLREELAPFGWFGMRGDLAVRSVGGPSRSLTLANAGWRIEAVPGGAAPFLARYKTYIFGAALVLLLVLLVWLYPRVVRRELDPAG